jgi:3-oxoacyl-[acyl-carrier protein] reductase
MTGERKLAIVTGGTRGIGFGICYSLAAKGFDLALTGLRASETVTETLQTLSAQGCKVRYYQSDLAKLSDHALTIERVVEDFGSIDCLVNNAGIASVERGDFLELKPENFDTIINTNLRGTVFFTQVVARSMLATKAAEPAKTIINITSVSATMMSPERLDYCMTKAALASFSSGLALRLAEDGIAVFEVRPGIIRTDMTSEVASKYSARIEAGLVPMRRWGETTDIGETVAALASGSFKFATGSVISADGGLSISRL